MKIFEYLEMLTYECIEFIKILQGKDKEWNENSNDDQLWENSNIYEEIYERITSKYNVINYMDERGSMYYSNKFTLYGALFGSASFSYSVEPTTTTILLATFFICKSQSDSIDLINGVVRGHDSTKIFFPDFANWKNIQIMKKEGLEIPKDLLEDTVLNQNRCPITNKPIMFPVKCIHGHYHEYAEIKKYINTTQKCPTADQPLSMNEIKVDKVLFDKIQNKLKELLKK